jgi:CubicO group peptidase (beta-lactamase class C family)
MAALLALSLAVSASAVAREDLAAVDKYVTDHMARQRIPGVALAILRNGKTLMARGYGVANVEHDVPVTPETIFQSGSVGKQFTAAAAMLLVEDGRLALTDPLTKFFPDAPAAWNRITIRHLLTHTSGLPDYTAGTIDYRRDYTEDELRRFAYGLTLEFEPGARWNYSNTGYVLLGILIHKSSGQFYGDLLRERVFGPLGMKTARIITEADIVPHRAAGYRLVEKELKNQEWVAPMLNTTADGSLYLSLNDMIAWDRALRSRQLLRQESWAQVFTPVALNSGKTYPYGFGWSVDDLAGHRTERHGGSWQGFKTAIARFPDDDLSIIVLANLAQANPEKIADDIAAILDPSFKPAELTPITDSDPAMQARVRRLLEQAASGKLNPDEFAYVRAGFFPNATKAYAEMLGQAGALRRLVLLESKELGDDRVCVYDVEFHKQAFQVRIAVAPDGKVAGFGLRSKPER